MLYTEKEKNEIERVRKVFADTSGKTAYDLVWSDKVGYAWLKIGQRPGILRTPAIIYTAEQLARMSA